MSWRKKKSNPVPASAPVPVMARPRFPVWLIAALLALVTIGLYWPATRYGFVNYDDQSLRYCECSRPKRIDLGRLKMGVFNPVSSHIGIR